MKKLKYYERTYGVKHYTNPKYRHRWDGFFWGFIVGLVPYLWHMYI